MNAIIINPPLVQLNTPYPSGAYLSAFFKSLGHNARWYDLSIDLYYSIFSKEGLSKLFELTGKKAMQMAEKAEQNGDEATAFNLRRYISTADYWIEWIDFINDTLRGLNTREKQHQFLFSPFTPRGARMENFLGGMEKEPSIDDVRFLCSYALADLADYITAVFDQDFSLIRYAESVAADRRSFSEIEQHLSSPVMKHFYEPVLKKYFSAGFNSIFEQTQLEHEKTLVLISIPFAGTYIPALYTAAYFKKTFGNKAYICIGGGYPNTELREFTNPALGKYVDAVSFDRGYGSYKDLLEKNAFDENLSFTAQSELKLYKLRRFVHDEKTVKCIDCTWEDEQLQAFESEVTYSLVPDYSDIDFSRYPRVCDDQNPMHRLWSDGSWIKAYLAHGCYWHKCAFCDTKLDYVCGYRPVAAEKLFYGLKKTAEQKKVFGIHFVDEALPPVALKQFALLNAQNNNELYYWGNIRFEKTFSKDLAAFLSFCGFGAVSAGLEVATGTGLKNINKGTDIDTIVAACAAFKEAGILVHAYMIYGFWYDTPQTIIDSMETLRQFFAAGLLDSAFWHKFMLTENSDLYDKLKDTWTGGKEYAKFGPPLEAALESWMHGEKLDMKVTKWFDFQVPSPSIPRNLIEASIEKYEKKSNKPIDFKQDLENSLYWLGSKPVLNGKRINWVYLQEAFQEKALFGNVNLAEILQGLSPMAKPEERKTVLEKIKKMPELWVQLQHFHNKGLVFVL